MSKFVLLGVKLKPPIYPYESSVPEQEHHPC
jgi:hypothetical protein